MNWIYILKKYLKRRSSKDFFLEDLQFHLIRQIWNEWLDSSSKNLRQRIPEKIFKKKIFRIQRISL